MFKTYWVFLPLFIKNIQMLSNTNVIVTLHVIVIVTWQVLLDSKLAAWLEV